MSHPAHRSSTRGGPSLRTRIRVLERDGYRCVYCGATPIQMYLHVDHVVPRSRGGTNDPENLVTACGDCNQGKGDLELALPAGVIPGPVAPERIRPQMRARSEARP